MCKFIPKDRLLFHKKLLCHLCDLKLVDVTIGEVLCPQLYSVFTTVSKLYHGYLSRC